MSQVRGGASWFDPPFERPAALGTREVQTLGMLLSVESRWSCRVIDGIAGSEAAFVEIIDADGMTRRLIDSPFGAFVTCSDAETMATLRVLDAEERELEQCPYSLSR